MRAMVLQQKNSKLILQDVEKPTPLAHEILIKVHACGICRTDLHVVDGELPDPKLPLIPGHQIIGTVSEVGSAVSNFTKGQRVGVPWLGGSCQSCEYCNQNQENLCENAIYTGYQKNGGFADYTVADSRFCFSIDSQYPDLQAAPLMCAGLIGYRALSKISDAKSIGFYGFGASAHILIQLAQYQRKKVYAFTRPGDHENQTFAKKMGATWSGDSTELLKEPLDGVIIFAADGELVPLALKNIKKGKTVVCAGIHMSDIPSFAYSDLWGERHICSIANLTRQDGVEFLKLAPKVPVKTVVNTYPLEKVNEALDELRHGRFNGAAVIQISTTDPA